MSRGALEIGEKMYEEEVYFSLLTLFPGASQLCRADKGTVWRSGGGLFPQFTSDHSVEKITRTDLYLGFLRMLLR